jgi:hypothetical protein
MNDNWQNILAEGKQPFNSTEKAHQWLNETRRSEFLLSLPDSETRNQWADTAVELIHSSNYTLESMMNDRVTEHPTVLFFMTRKQKTAGGVMPRSCDNLAGMLQHLSMQ